MNLKPTLKRLIGLVKFRPRIAIVAAVVLLGLGWLILGGTSGEDASAYHTVSRGNFLVSVVEGGNLEAVNETVVRNEVDGDSRIIYIVPEGTYVKKGDVIVELDSAEAEQALKDQEITFETSSAAYITALNDLEIMKSTVDSEIRAAELALTLAKMDLDKFEQLEREQQLRQASLDIDTSEEELKLAQQTFEISKHLQEEGFETKSTVDRDSVSVSRSYKSAENAKSTYEMLERYDLAKLYAEYKSTLEEAKRELERVKKQGESKIAQATADKNSAEATLRLTEEKLKKMKDQLSLSQIVAPQDGLIVYSMSQSRFSQESMVEEGAQVRKRQELVKIPDTSRMKVTLKVHESHVGQVQAGQPAFVVLDSLPDQQFRGEVTKVGILPDAQSRWGNPNLKVYSTEVVITDPIPDVKPGVSARAEIVVANLQDVLTVPIQAVTTLKGQQVCYVKKFRGPESVPVEIGMFNSSFIEIKSGLSEGDQVLLAPPISEEVDRGGVLDDTEGLELPTEPLEAPSRPGADEGGRQRGEGPGGDEGRGTGTGGGDADRRTQMMQRFDTDGDGKLSEEERSAMREAFGGGGAGGGNASGGGGIAGGRGGAGGGGDGRPEGGSSRRPNG